MQVGFGVLSEAAGSTGLGPVNSMKGRIPLNMVHERNESEHGNYATF